MRKKQKQKISISTSTGHWVKIPKTLIFQKNFDCHQNFNGNKPFR